MKVVYEAGNIIDAHLVRHALEYAGIPAFVSGEALLGGLGELPVCGMVAVCVPDSCWPDACDVLRALPLLANTPVPAALEADALDADALDADDGVAFPADAAPWPLGAA